MSVNLKSLGAYVEWKYLQQKPQGEVWVYKDKEEPVLEK